MRKIDAGTTRTGINEAFNELVDDHAILKILVTELLLILSEDYERAGKCGEFDQLQCVHRGAQLRALYTSIARSPKEHGASPESSDSIDGNSPGNGDRKSLGGPGAQRHAGPDPIPQSRDATMGQVSNEFTLSQAEVQTSSENCSSAPNVERAKSVARDFEREARETEEARYAAGYLVELAEKFYIELLRDSLRSPNYLSFNPAITADLVQRALYLAEQFIEVITKRLEKTHAESQGKV